MLIQKIDILVGILKIEAEQPRLGMLSGIKIYVKVWNIKHFLYKKIEMFGIVNDIQYNDSLSKIEYFCFIFDKKEVGKSVN